MGAKGGDDVTTGYRYGFSILSGICRGPVDQLFLIKADGKIFFDQPANINTIAVVDAQQLFGGDKGQGGIYGVLQLFFGRFDQIIPADSTLRSIMNGLRVSQLRGVVTSFFDGQICSNDPYPKAWQYRVRRALKGWHNDECWYPEKALIRLSDPSIATYAVGPSGGNSATSTTLVDSFGNPTDDPTAAISEVTTTYQQQQVSTYTVGTGTSTTYNVPQFYNDIYAMNPAHIIYECVTNPDWGRGLPRELVDNTSFASAANTLYDEGFGLCMKWAQQEDIDAFVQIVIDHIGAAVYTNPITGLLSIRLIRKDYDVASLPTFDYEHGLLEVTSVQTASSDAIANEVIIKYHSPVTDSDREARAQNIASINSLGSFFPVTKDYSGLPTSTLALKVAARELRINSGGWKRVEFKVDRRGYAVVPGDVINLTALDRGLESAQIRIATVDQSQIKDGYITLVGAQDIFGWPLHTTQEPQLGTFQEVNRFPQKVQAWNISEGTYRDVVKFGHNTVDDSVVPSPVDIGGIGNSFVTVMAQQPSSVSIAFATYVKRISLAGSTDAALAHDWELRNYLNFQRLSVLTSDIGVADTTFEISGDITPASARIGGCYVICTPTNGSTPRTDIGEEFIRLDAISQNPTTGAVTITVARGCVDTPATPKVKGSRVWAYDESGGAINEAYGFQDWIEVKALTHTVSRGDLDPSVADIMTVFTNLRPYRPYIGAGFKVNGYFRDQIPPQSGDLILTWHHRNRVTQAEHLFGEEEADIPPESGTTYGVYISLTTAIGTATDLTHLTDITDDTVTITRDELISFGCVTGRIKLQFHTMRTIGSESLSAQLQVFCEFDYIVDAVPPDTDTSGGFNFDFDNNFTGG